MRGVISLLPSARIGRGGFALNLYPTALWVFYWPLSPTSRSDQLDSDEKWMNALSASLATALFQ
jgi:hypothetical protein